jgi:hypothetical protein
MPLPLHENRRVASLVYVTNAAMHAIELLRIDAVQLSHPARESGRTSLYQQMIVVGHEAVAVTQPVVPLAHLRKNGEERPSIRIVEIDRLAAVSARGDVIEGAGELKT